MACRSGIRDGWETTRIRGWGVNSSPPSNVFFQNCLSYVLVLQGISPKTRVYRVCESKCLLLPLRSFIYFHCVHAVNDFFFKV